MTAAGAPLRVPSLVDALLAEQQLLPVVERFARDHDAGALPDGARRWEERIPLESPGPGQQLAFQVDLDACTGCKACVTACHSLNGLAEEETWREVGLLVGEGNSAGLQQTVTTACHHCEDPGCLSGCPVRAYEKDPVTGVVHHLDDQCIGCQYCLLTCPYDIPRYSAELGIVRKCDMCAGRLAEGEAPACVQGCPNGAITIRIVERAGDGKARELLPGAAAALPDPALTRPTTRYVSARGAAAWRPADNARLAPAQAHDPLAVMLVLVQLSVGTLFFEALGAAAGPLHGPAGLVLAAGAGAAGLGAATLHLGRPLHAYRAFLGWRTSWMSREILVLGAYVPAVTLAATVALTGVAAPWLPALRAAALASGLAVVFCSAMIYADTGRPAWSLARTGALFAGTSLGLGAVAAGALGLGGPLVAAGAVVLAAKLAFESEVLGRRGRDPLARSARLLRGPLRGVLRARAAAASAGLFLAVTALVLSPSFGLASLACLAAGELLERHLFFRAAAGAGMPGA